MKSTIYLTGHPPSRYIHKLQPLALLRVADMRELKSKLRLEAYDLHRTSDRYKEIIKQHDEIVKAIEFWQGLLDEA